MNIEIRIRSFQIFMLSINSQSSQKLITIGVVDGAPALMSNITGMFSIYKVCQWHGLAPLRITTNKSNFWCFFSAQTYTFIPPFTDFLGKCCFMQRHPLNFSLRPQFLLAIFNYAIENGVNFELFVMPLIFSHNLLCIVIQMKILW